jgi:hypothetical protein
MFENKKAHTNNGTFLILPAILESEIILKISQYHGCVNVNIRYHSS